MILPQSLPITAQFVAIAVDFAVIAAHLGAVAQQFARAGPVAVVPLQVAPVRTQIPLVAPQLVAVPTQFTPIVPHRVGSMAWRRAIEQRGIGGLGRKGGGESQRGQCASQRQECAFHRGISIEVVHGCNRMTARRLDEGADVKDLSPSPGPEVLHRGDECAADWRR